ncbi:MAG TPA: peptidylprolyl isomerase [Cyclobacteriaceae bacterium]|nr:peptidylprolyl isomerase [Cyclobacteriaceae bacterium]
MKITLILFITIIFFFGCETKPKSIVITQENVVDVLTKYGKENPENEVLIETKYGKIRLKLFEDTPLHRANFVKLIKEGFYDDDANFYRIVYEFMIQGGDLKQNLTYRIPAEFHQKYFHKKGALSMARVSENNPEMQSSASDFFIIHGGRYTEEDIEIDSKNLALTLTPEQKQAYINEGGYMELDQKYTVFGEVLEGLEVVDKIASEKVFDVDKPLKEIPFKISLIGKK